MTKSKIIIFLLILALLIVLRMFQIEMNANKGLCIKNSILKSFLEDSGIADKEWLEGGRINVK